MSVGPEALERADDKAPGGLDRAGAGGVGGLEFGPGVGGELQQLRKPGCLGGIPKDTEQADHFAVQIVVDLAVGSGLAQQHARRAGVRLDVDAVFGHVLDDPGGKAPFAAVPAQGWARERSGRCGDVHARAFAFPGAGLHRRGGVFDGIVIGVGPELSGEHSERVGLHRLSSGGAAFNATGTPDRWNAAPACQVVEMLEAAGVGAAGDIERRSAFEIEEAPVLKAHEVGGETLAVRRAVGMRPCLDV